MSYILFTIAWVLALIYLLSATAAMWLDRRDLWPKKWRNKWRVILLLALFPVAARAQGKLPEAPRPKVADAKFFLALGALGGAMAFDMAETRSMINRGGFEYNWKDFGPHPSNAHLAAVESAYFAGSALLAYEMKKPHAWIPRPIGRVLRATWWVPLGLEIGNHTRLGIQDRNACRPGCGKGGGL